MPDREKVKKELLELNAKAYGLWVHDQKNEFLAQIGNVTDDVLTLLKEQEAKTGYWIDSAGNDKCSICGEEYSDLYPDYGNTHFCPNCGAKMEGR